MPEKTERLTLAQAVAQMTPANIRGWLKTQPPERTFKCTAPYRCVISEYLADAVGGQCYADYEHMTRGLLQVETPEWCAIFMRRFDRARDSYRDVNSTLRILRECCPELRRKHAN